ncbi:MAG: 2-oxoacid:acceptor oxidoreductase family protein [Candidatus Bathyarchaeia archaeon]
MRLEIRIAGTGGQGIVLAGKVLARAAALYDCLHVYQTELYGAQVRGGFSSTDLVISDQIVDYPGVLQPDLLVILSSLAYKRLISCKPKIVLTDEDINFSTPYDSTVTIYLPLLKTAKRVGSEIALNMVAIGSLSALTACTRLDSLKSALKDLTTRFIELNLKALDEGWKLGNEWCERNATLRVRW